MPTIELILAMLLAVMASGYLVRMLPASVPLPVVQIVLGMGIASILHQGVRLDPAIFFLLFLPPLLFLDGWRIPKDGLMRDSATIGQLALGLVIFTVIGAGFFIHWMIPAMPLAAAFALAAVLSPTDPVAVSSITARIAMPKRLMHILEGESLLNDASGLVCFQFAVAAAVTGAFSFQEAATTFAWVAIIGLASGVVVTVSIAAVQQWITRRFGEEGGSSILVNLLIPFAAYLLAEQLHASGILAAVAAGITMSYVELTAISMASTRLERSAVWSTIQFTLNGVIFVLLGEQLPGIIENAIANVNQLGHRSAWWLIIYAVAITVGLIALRFAWVWISIKIHLLRTRRKTNNEPSPSRRLILATSLAGVRGAITLAGVLTLPFVLDDGSPFPVRSIIIFLAAAVILLSLLIASIAMPLVLRNLQFPHEPTSHQEIDNARTAAAQAAIEAIQNTASRLQQPDGSDADLCAEAASRVIAFYQKRVRNAAYEEEDAERLRQSDQIEKQLWLAGLDAERSRILEMARNRHISDETSRRLVRQIDLLESWHS